MTNQLKGVFYHAQKMAHQWQIYTPPVVPSKSECRIIERFVARHKKPARILILGGTPQFRDLVHYRKAEVTCVDISFDVLTAMTRLIKNEQNTQKEIWVRASWLTMPLAQNYYDFVLGDLVINNLPVKLWPEFFTKIKEVLKPGGYFITRHDIPVFPQKSIQEVIDRAIRRNFNHKNLTEFAWDALFVVWDKRDGSMSTGGVSQALKRARRAEKDVRRKKQIDKLNKAFQQDWPVGKTWWTLSEKEGEKIIKRHFKIFAIKYGTDHPFVSQCPIYFLKKIK